MAPHNEMPKLPVEIQLSIIDAIAPADLPQIALPRNHPFTKTLVALTYTSRALQPHARRLLYTHCLYIHTPNRLRKLLRSIQESPQDVQKDLLDHATSLYLRPYPVDGTIADVGITNDVLLLMTTLAPRLRRLLVDIPFRSVYPDEDRLGVRPVLRNAFSNLPAVEEFCSVRDELYLELGASDGPGVWSGWERLKTLVLYNVDMATAKFWKGLYLARGIETVVLTRADGLREVDMKQEWRHCFRVDGTEGEERRLDFLLVNVDAEHTIPLGWERRRKEDKLQVRILNVPISYYGDEDLVVICQHWVKRRVLQGVPVEGWS
ncbi:hypothetical protein ONS95_010704 [Cadophora gregata]|uniref:uncharacterized protein n=1 Tax=Cadophora gregata TaxID=51156 RepID=UPI0026DD00D8|nr:uncharacterized protein ONS95_010704 [Cadophora gregata]KAK0122472.1 hypothetical protein ONS95_010704 [Cadophora gregata]KAK0127949.1 hypothetical protein ONS96_007447 [Cadophora gregata f. sp. sojae]